MLAKGLCFNCGEPGHLSRNCPKKQTIPSKNKGKPPGISAHAADSDSESDSDDDSLPGLQSVSDSSCESDSESDSGPPSLEPMSGISDSGSEDSEASHLVMPGDGGETFEDWIKLWAEASKEVCFALNNAEVPPRSRRLGDVLGNTVAALLEFFQPFPGDEQVPWSDERRDSVRFRVLRPSEESYVIEDSYFDDITVLPLEYLRVPKFHLCEWYARKRAMDLGIEYFQALP
ncbi:hypothetical protein B0H19DRAFT_923460, partial [Mycena capillaripes]